jgi:hypothetical protein
MILFVTSLIILKYFNNFFKKIKINPLIYLKTEHQNVIILIFCINKNPKYINRTKEVWSFNQFF